MSDKTTHEASKIIFGAVYQGLSKKEYIENPIESRTVFALAREFHLRDYNILIRSKIQEFLINISREIVRRTPRPSFQAILDTHNYIEDDLHLQKNSKAAQEIQKYQVYTYSPETNKLTYILITSRNYGASTVHRLLIYLDKAFFNLYPELQTHCKLSQTKELYNFPELREKLKTCQDQRKVDKIAEVNTQIDEVKDIMIKNIEDLLERGEKIEDLIYKTEELKYTSDVFRQRAKRMNRCCTIL